MHSTGYLLCAEYSANHFGGYTKQRGTTSLQENYNLTKWRKQDKTGEARRNGITPIYVFPQLYSLESIIVLGIWRKIRRDMERM